MHGPTRRPRTLPQRLESRRLFSAYGFTDLGNLGAGTVLVTDVNDAGQVAGVANGHAFRWQAGALSDLGTLGGAASRPTGMNNLGQVVGVSSVDAATESPFLWKDGVMSALPLGDGVEPVAINDAGDIAFNRGGHAMLWRDGAAIDLGELVAGGGSGAADVNDAGVVVGSAYSGRAGALGLPVSDAFAWRDGVMTDLGTAPFTYGSFPAAVNNRGQMAGSTTIFVNTGYGAAFLSRSFFYDGTTMSVLPVGTIQNYATDLNDAGQVVGTMGGGPYLYEDGVVTNLNTLVAPGTPLLGSAAAINNAGQVLGYTSSGRPFLLTPLPPGVASAARVIDDGTAGFSVTGPPPAVLSTGYQGDARRIAPGYRVVSGRRIMPLASSRSTATWSFGDVAPGTYRVSTTWQADPVHGTSAPYSVLNGSAVLANVAVNQRVAPAVMTWDSTKWKDLGTFKIDSGPLTVRVTNSTAGPVVADAVRIERVDSVSVAPVPVAPASVDAPLRRAAFRLTSDLKRSAYGVILFE